MQVHQGCSAPNMASFFVIKCPVPMRYLPQMAPTASDEYLCCLLFLLMLPPTSTCYRPRPPRLRGLLKEAPGILCCGLLLPRPNSFPAAIFCHSIITRSSSGPKIGGGGVCILHIPRNNLLQKALCAKDREHLNDTFWNRFEVH